MGRKMGEKRSSLFALANVKRCLSAALVSVAFFPLLLLFSIVEPKLAEYYMIPAAFFSVVSVAFSYLLYQMIRKKAKRYYELTVFVYLTVFHMFFVYMAQENIIFYYATVVLAGYLVCLPMERYVIMALGELVCFAAIVVKGGMKELTMGQLLFLSFVHLFAFVMSRDYYAVKRSYLLEEKKLRHEIQEAEHDPLTGLMNRRGLNRCVQEIWQKSMNRQEMVAAFVMDIDLFKSYNDRFGHVQGDVCIKRVAHSIAKTVQGYGIAARIGGEEFLVIVHGRSVQEMYDLAEQIRADVEAMGISRGTPGADVVTISIGVDIRYVGPEVTLQGMYGRADQGLYLAKQSGRNCVRGAQIRRERQTRTG